MDFVDNTTVSPLLTGIHDPAREVEHAPPLLREVAVRQLEVDHLRGPHGRVVHASEERFEVRAPAAPHRHGGQQSGDLIRVGDARGGDLFVDVRGYPPNADEGARGEVALLDSCGEHLTNGSVRDCWWA